jgi:hypothetical protein
MGTFTETEIVDNCLSFANPRKQTSVVGFHLQQTIGRLSFPFSICSKQTEVAIPLPYIHTHTKIHRKRNYICMLLFQIENRCLDRQFSSICLLFAPQANGRLSFVPFVDKETNRSYPSANGLNGLNGPAHLWSYQ